MPGPQRIIVSIENGNVLLEMITQDKQGNDISVLDPPNPLRLFLEDEEEAQWECGNGVAAIEVIFNKNGTPFTIGKFVASGEVTGLVQSGLPLDDGPRGLGEFSQFRYSLIITPMQGGIITIDPRVRTYRRFSRNKTMHDVN